MLRSVVIGRTSPTEGAWIKRARHGEKNALVIFTPEPPDPVHKKAYRLVETYYQVIKDRTGRATRIDAMAAEVQYQTAKQVMIDLVEAGLRSNLGDQP